MKLNYLLAFLILSMTVAFTSCQNDKSDQIRNEARQTLPVPPPNAATNTPTPPATPMTFNAEPHYKCPNNCAGGIGAAAGTCPACGTQLAHNQAYHNQANNTATTPPTISPTGAPQAPSPAQNAAGVYHYTCSNGCAGGAGSAGTCATCGGTLAHNTAYHGG